MLDLIFANKPGNLAECSVIDLGTESDHKLVKTELSIHEKVNEDQSYHAGKTTLAGQIDFNSAEEEIFKACLNDTDWRKIITEAEPDKVGATYVTSVCQAALKAHAARYDSMAGKRKRKREREIEGAVSYTHLTLPTKA